MEGTTGSRAKRVNPKKRSFIYLFLFSLEIEEAEAQRKTTRDFGGPAKSEGSPVSPGQCSCTQVTIMAAVHFCGFELVDHHPYFPDLAPSDYFLFPNIKNTFSWEAVSDQRWGHTCRTFARIRMRASILRESKHDNNDGKSVWTAGKTMLKNTPHLVKFDHCITISPWTFQPTLIERMYTERQKKLITSSGQLSLKSTASKLIIFGHK